MNKALCTVILAAVVVAAALGYGIAPSHAASSSSSSSLNFTTNAIPVFPIWNDSDVPMARYFLSMASAKALPTSVIVVVYNASKSNIKELLNVERLILVRSNMIPTDENIMTLYSLHIAITLVRDACILLLSRKHIIVPREGRKEWNQFLAFNTECDEVPIRFTSVATSPSSSPSTMLLLPPRTYARELYHQLANWSMTLDASTASSILSSPQWLTKTYDTGFQREPSYHLNPLSCSKRHILRSPPPLRTNTIPITYNGQLVCMCVPLYGASTHFVTTTIRSLMKSLSTSPPSRHIAIFAAVEESDSILGLPVNQQNLSQHVAMEVGNGPISFHLTTFPYIEQDIVYLWNSLFLQAYETGCDYLMHITSDVDFMRTTGAGYGWLDKFVTLLQDNGNIGAIGNSEDLNTMPFVHRTHLDIFQGQFYPKAPHNVYSDTSLWLIYKAFALLLGPPDLAHWVNLSDEIPEKQRNNRTYTDCQFRLSIWDVPDWSDYSSQHMYEFFQTKHSGGRVMTRVPTISKRKWRLGILSKINKTITTTHSPSIQ